MTQQTALQKAIEEIKNMAGEFENQRIPAVYLLSKIIPLLEYEKEQKEISDEEIEKASENYAWTIKTNTFSDPVKANELAESSIQDFKEAIKWYREQLKNK